MMKHYVDSSEPTSPYWDQILEVLINYAHLCEEYGAEEDSPPNKG